MFLKNALKEKKQASGLSVAEISRRSGLKPHYVSKLLYDNIDKPSSQTLDKLAKAFGCQAEDFVSEEKIEDVKLFREASRVFEVEAKDRGLNLNDEKVSKTIMNLYNYAYLRKKNRKKPYIDTPFINWLFTRPEILE